MHEILMQNLNNQEAKSPHDIDVNWITRKIKSALDTNVKVKQQEIQKVSQIPM